MDQPLGAGARAIVERLLGASSARSPRSESPRTQIHLRTGGPTRWHRAGIIYRADPDRHLASALRRRPTMSYPRRSQPDRHHAGYLKFMPGRTGVPSSRTASRLLGSRPRACRIVGATWVVSTKLVTSPA